MNVRSKERERERETDLKRRVLGGGTESERWQKRGINLRIWIL